jgi:hypothetical protein
METDDLKLVLARVLGLRDDDISRSAPYAEARTYLAECMAGSAEPAPLSIEELAAYARGAMDGEELQAFEQRMVASEQFRQEVMSALEFLDDVDAVDEAAPAGLVDALLAEERVAVSAADDVQSAALTAAVLLSFFQGKQSLTREQQAMLFRDPQLRAEFDRLKRQFAMRTSSGDILEMPALAAAANDSGLGDQPLFIDRPLQGGHVQSGRVKGWESDDGMVQILFILDEIENPPGKFMLVGSEEGEQVRLDLPLPDRDGKILLLKDKEKEDDRLFLRLLQDTKTVGTFLPRDA